MAEVTVAELMSFQAGMTDQQKLIFMSQYNSDKKDRNIVLILSVLLGYFGIDRFYVGDVGIGLLKLFTGGVCGVLWLIDLFLIRNKADEQNRNKAREIALTIKTMG